jgi:hypothetical protein
MEVPLNRLRSLAYGQAGQTTTEYATTLLVVLFVTGALAAFVKGGGLDGLFDGIVAKLIDKVQG